MRTVLKILLWLLIALVGSSVLAVVVYKYVPVYVTPLMVIRAVSPVGSNSQQQRQRHPEHRWVPLDEMSPWMPRAVVSSEDGNFYRHHGFDFEQIEIALEERREGKRERGASTISQQTAKNVFLWNGHSWIRKGLEAYFTVLIEAIWGKERIMEVYLNSIEMGAGIYGTQAAADYYFGCDASELSRRQCALIAVSLPSPLKRDPAHPTPWMLRRANTISRYMGYN